MRICSFDELVSSGEFHNTGTVLSIGVFDGVHLGHKAILETLQKEKEAKGAELSAVITFSVNPKGRKGAIDTLRLRAEYIASFGVDILAVIDFSPVFSKISACVFTTLLLKAFLPEAAIVGSDFRFGNPSDDGDGKKLGELLKLEGVDTEIIIVDSVLDPYGERISSTRLRQMIEKGDLGCFLRLSGQFYRVDLVPLPYRSGSGELIFSRASIHQLLPPPGAYDAALRMRDGQCAACVAFIDGENLRIKGAGTDSESYENGKGELLLDSLYLENRR